MPTSSFEGAASAASFNLTSAQWRERMFLEQRAACIPTVQASERAYQKTKWNKSMQRPLTALDPERPTAVVFPHARVLTCTLSNGNLSKGWEQASLKTAASRFGADDKLRPVSSIRGLDSTGLGSAWGAQTLSFSAQRSEGWGSRHVQNRWPRRQIAGLGFQLHTDLLGFENR
eukprot:CAMPEP_0183355664 /NCGR_PEP_ID=MMETSP0164_2-20130417/41328_1 /TAXON_ID=221442 /ORGANISM="Coccolithus pelagicus ssp braarudi, Strain PLY182g" /LENGTH=172 /DNA_ID=CAMNT_0025528833 /DNA_START=66 /DNA_END=584 /DNA_ORIENTATION=-